MTLNKFLNKLYMNLQGGSYGGARKRMFHPKHCSPSDNDVNGSCLDSELIIKVAESLNKMNSKNSKHTKNNIDIINTNKISDCSSEACWQKIHSLMKLLGNSRNLFKESFKPLMPKSWIKDYNEWLSTFEIEDCLNQHMNDDNNFYFYGAVPIDFKKCSVSNLCKFNIKKHLNNGESKIGIVFNTDPSTKDGEHWISMYIDLGKHNSDNYGIYYFDSYGEKPPKEIKELINKIIKQGIKYKCKPLYFYNDYSYQKKNAQCGMYAIHFIKKMIEGLSFNDYLKSKLNDNLMIKLRDEYFIRL